MNIELIIFISGAWPGNNKGYEIANLSILEYFSSKINHSLYFGPSEEVLSNEVSKHFSKCTFQPVNFNRKPRAVRFLRSIFSEFPAISERFWGTSNEIISVIEKQNIAQKSEILFFYEDIPSAFLMLDLKKKYPDSLHYVRSHNVVYKGFYGMAHGKNFITNLLWKYELNRIYKFEKSVFKISDTFFSFSEDDCKYYQENMQIYPNGSIGFFLDESYFEKTPDAGKNNLLFLGKPDLRKARALKRFIETAWPIIRRNDPEVKLLIAGKKTESFHNPKSGIHAYGFISDVHSFFEKGSIFINPQTEGAGIKIKSVVALAKTKTLVTTSVGAEGIGIRNGIHCIIEDDFEKQASIIIQLLENKNQQKNLAVNGFNHVQSAFSRSSFFQKMDHLFKSYFD